MSRLDPNGVLLPDFWGGEDIPEKRIPPPEITEELMQDTFLLLYQAGLDDFIFGTLDGEF